MQQYANQVIQGRPNQLARRLGHRSKLGNETTQLEIFIWKYSDNSNLQQHFQINELVS